MEQIRCIFDDNLGMFCVLLQEQRTNGPVNAHLISGISTKDKMAEQTLTLITNNT